MRLFISALILFSLSSLGYCELMPFVQIIKTGDEDSTSFSWETSGNKYHLDGYGILKSAGLAKNRQLNLPIERFVDRLAVLNLHDDMFLTLETSYGGEGPNYICRVNINLGKVYWCRQVAAFNINASASADSIWMGGAGTIARINPKSGKYIWNIANLYKPETAQGAAFFDICPVLEDGATVTFNSRDTNRSGSIAKKILVDQNSGKIINVADIGVKKVCK